MDGILTLKVQLQNIYANYSKIIDKAVRFVLAFITFFAISKNIGYMHVLTNPVITLGLSLVCAFLPDIFTVLAAAVLVLAHIYAVSLGNVIVAAFVFFLMFVFYLRLAPKTAIAVILMPVAFMLKIPTVVPVGFALVCAPSYAVSVGLGTIAYYIIGAVKKSAAATQAAEEAKLMTDLMGSVKQIFQNKEMWIMVAAAIICMLAVYGIKKAAIAHAWKVASAAGAALYLIVAVAGGTVFGCKVSMTSLAIGAVAAVIAGCVLEILFFCVDYSKCENLQFEDDEYFYYVKAVPKVGVAAPQKEVKEINRRGEFREEAEVIDAEELRKRPKKEPGKPSASKNAIKKKPVQQGKRPKGTPKKQPIKRKSDLDNADQLLLTQSLKKDLNLDDK
ncbi:MAG: hypothetical protein Q4B75_00285 [Eubacteriales bacterium]|nr:hypothetical protein [Eubacteriales bacterium]